MNTIHKLSAVASALVLGVGMACTAGAQSTGGDSGAGGQGGGVTASSNNNFGGWMKDHSMKNKGRISRQAYMDESGRRWDMMDKDRQGLTYDQVNGLYGHSAIGMGGPTATNPQEKKGIQR